MKRFLALILLVPLCVMGRSAAAVETAITIKPVELKKAPYTDAETLATLPEKAPVAIVERQGGWTHVRSAAQLQCWVRMLSLRLGNGAAKQGDLGLASVLNAARTGSSGITVTTDVRGLSEEELRNAHPNPVELDKVERITVTAQDAHEFAVSANLNAVSVAYLPPPPNARLIGRSRLGSALRRPAMIGSKCLRAIALTLGLAILPAHALDLQLDRLRGILIKASQLQPADDRSEIEIGRGIAVTLLGAAPLARNERLQQYVNQVGRWVAMQTERADLVWHFGVLEGNDVNAFTTPGGYVFITRGLLLSLRNEAELAGVPTHEIAHVVRQHHMQAIQRNAQAGLFGDIVGLAVQNRKNSNALSKAIGAGTEIYARGLDKEDEFEADRMGVVIAARAGYDPYGLPAVLQTLESMNPQTAAWRCSSRRTRHHRIGSRCWSSPCRKAWTPMPRSRS